MVWPLKATQGKWNDREIRHREREREREACAFLRLACPSDGESATKSHFIVLWPNSIIYHICFGTWQKEKELRYKK